MKTKYLVSFIIISLGLIGLVSLANKVFAQETTGIQNIQYPVKELGNCQDKSACKSYCDKSENIKACVGFAEKNNLMSQEEIDLAKKFMAGGSKGPGSCRGKDECEVYCNDIAHIDECVSFAENNNLMPSKDLAEAKKVQAAIKRGVKPPSCKNKDACDVYCEDPNHMEECITFGAEAGFIQGKELQDAQKMLAALKKGIKPPPCKGKEACDTYCSNPDNMEECMTFAMEAGMMSEQEKADSQKMLQAIKKGVKPPNCRGKDECDVYCQQEEHFDECTKFAEAAGFMSSEEAAMARKTGGKGPAGCKGKDECDAFCNNPDNQETCFNFAKENGMIPEADLKQMEEGKQKFKESLNQAPSAVLDCLDSKLGSEMMEKFKSGAVMPPREIGDKMRECFEKMGPVGPSGQGGPGAGGMVPPAGQTGPGGCQSADECQIYCESHPDECQNSAPGGGEQQFAPGTGPAGPNGQGIPGGPNGAQGQPGEGPSACQSLEECQQMQNRLAPSGAPRECQGEQCLPGSPPNQPGESMLPNPPQNQISPQSPPPLSIPQPSMNNIAPPPPPPAEAPAPPASSIINPKSPLGFLLKLFSAILNH